MITLDTPMLGPVDVGSVPAGFYLGAYDAETVDHFWAALLFYAPIFGIRASLVAAQIAKETGWFKFGGQVHPAQFNLAGLGATNGGAAGLSYASIEEGVLAVFVHHMVYLYGDHALWEPLQTLGYSSLDERYDAVMSTGRGGTVRVLGDYKNGWWAFSKEYPIGSLDNGYATGIRDIANTLSTEVQEAPVGVPYDRIHFSADYGPDRAVADIGWFVVHDTEGYFAGDEGVLTSAAAPVESASFLIGRTPEDGCVYVVPIDKTPWCCANQSVDKRGVSVELSGFRGQAYTDYQYQKLAEVFRWCRSQGMVNVPPVYIGRVDADGGPLPDLPGIIGHQDVPDGAGGWGGEGHHTDPGPTFDWGRLEREIGGGTVPSPAPAPAPTSELLFFQPDNPFGRVPITGLFWARLDFLEQTQPGLGLATYGYARRAEQFTNGRWMQAFERGWMATNNGSDPFNVVTLPPNEWPQ